MKMKRLLQKKNPFEDLTKNSCERTLMSFAGWVEILFIGALALVIIGPQDLPKVLFTLGKWIRVVKNIAFSFRQGFEEVSHLGFIEDLKKNDESSPKNTPSKKASD